MIDTETDSQSISENMRLGAVFVISLMLLLLSTSARIISTGTAPALEHWLSWFWALAISFVSGWLIWATRMPEIVDTSPNT
jgi:hypothetical protein